MELSPEEKRRIYEEEKARIEAQETIKREKESADKKNGQSAVTIWSLGCLGILVLIFLIPMFSSLFLPHDRGGSSSGRTSPSPGDAGFVKGVGRDVLRQELDQWSAIGLVTNYEFSEQSVVVYLDHSKWTSIMPKNRADFEAGIRSKWPDGSVTFRDSQSGERL